MQWDIGDDWQTEEQQPVAERQIMPTGRHTMTIKFAEEGPNEYKRSDENPEGLCLKLRLSDLEGRHSFIFDDLPRTKSLAWRAKQLAAALGIQPTGETLVIDPKAIVDRTVDVEVSHYTSRAGKTSAQVKRYLSREPAPAAPAPAAPAPAAPAPAAPAPAAPAPAAPRTQAAKVTASLDSDAIPF